MRRKFYTVKHQKAQMRIVVVTVSLHFKSIFDAPSRVYWPLLVGSLNRIRFRRRLNYKGDELCSLRVESKVETILKLC